MNWYNLKRPSLHCRLHMPTHAHMPRVAPVYQRMLAVAMTLMLLIVGTACTLDPSSSMAHPTPTNAVNPLSRIHNASEDNSPLFVTVDFTPTTTYEQALVILRDERVDPWGCDAPHTPPPSRDERRAAFDRYHTLFISYPTWDQLKQIAASPHVISLYGGAYPCP